MGACFCVGPPGACPCIKGRFQIDQTYEEREWHIKKVLEEIKKEKREEDETWNKGKQPAD